MCDLKLRVLYPFTTVQADHITYSDVAEKCQGFSVLRYGLSRARKLTKTTTC